MFPLIFRPPLKYLSVSHHLILIKAYHYAPASRLAPFSYSQLIWVTIIGLIVQQSLILGTAGWGIGLVLILLVKDVFPRRVVLEPFNVAVLAGIIVVVCLAASGLGVRAALKVDPATALGG